MKFNHPEHGELEVLNRIGRSRVCRKQDGTTVTLSSKLINKLTTTATPVAPEEFVESVRLYLESLGEGHVQVSTARDTWTVCEEFLKS